MPCLVSSFFWAEEYPYNPAAKMAERIKTKILFFTVFTPFLFFIFYNLNKFSKILLIFKLKHIPFIICTSYCLSHELAEWCKLLTRETKIRTTVNGIVLYKAFFIKHHLLINIVKIYGFRALYKANVPNTVLKYLFSPTSINPAVFK